MSVGDDGDNVTIRFTTDNPGPWFLHCHIDYHLEAGFAIVLAEETDEVTTSVTPSSKSPLCPAIYSDAHLGSLLQLPGRTSARSTPPRTRAA